MLSTYKLYKLNLENLNTIQFMAHIMIELTLRESNCFRKLIPVPVLQNYCYNCLTELVRKVAGLVIGPNTSFTILQMHII